MIGKCCGARMVRNVTSAPRSALVVEPHFRGIDAWSSWSIMRGNLCHNNRIMCYGSHSSGGSESDNDIVGFAEFVLESASSNQVQAVPPISDNVQSIYSSNQKLPRKYSVSLRGLQLQLLSTLPKSKMLVSEVSKLIVENGDVAVRVKSHKDVELIKEWIGIQNEIQTIRVNRVDEDTRKFHVAGQEVIKEMARLTKRMNLDELDQAIEGALCSQAKSDCGQQKSFHDN